MKQVTIHDYPLIHVEVTMGLLKEDGSQYTSREVTAYLQELNVERFKATAQPITFKVFSGYAPYVKGILAVPEVDPDPSAKVKTEIKEVMENVVLLHLDYNPEGQAEERFNTLYWYMSRLLNKFGQSVAYAHFATNGGHRMLTFSLEETDRPESGYGDPDKVVPPSN